MSNLDLYNKVRAVPKEAQKEIKGGRLNGKTDINPMWRIKTLTDQFGVCGFGWRTEIVREWLEQGADGEVTANVEINLYIKQGGEWSTAIPGIGGSALIAKEKGGLYTDDDCYKKAYTDAISVACKALGIGADVYFEKDSTKYDKPAPAANTQQSAPNASATPSVREQQIERLVKGTKYTIETANEWARKKFGKPNMNDITDAQYNELYNALNNAVKKERGNG